VGIGLIFAAFDRAVEEDEGDASAAKEARKQEGVEHDAPSRARAEAHCSLHGRLTVDLHVFRLNA